MENKLSSEVSSTFSTERSQYPPLFTPAPGKQIIVSPSLLSADFLSLGSEIDMINRSDAQWLHLDVMDGVFVPNLSFGFPIMEAVAPRCQKFLDAHFMVEAPDGYVERSARAGVQLMTVHYEACKHLHRTLSHIHSNGMLAGIALNPATPVNVLEDIAHEADLILIMSVNPGFGGQKFIPHSLNKITALRNLLERTGSKALIEVDGGVNQETAPLLVKAGADVLVSGSYIFAAKDPLDTIARLATLSR